MPKKRVKNNLHDIKNNKDSLFLIDNNIISSYKFTRLSENNHRFKYIHRAPRSSRIKY